jgi:hyperosmotically inducible periplasmic protein
MKRAILIALGTGALISSAAAIGIGATATGAPEARLTRASYEQGVSEARAQHERAAAACEPLKAAEREVCRAEAEAAAAVRTADLKADFLRTQEAAREAQKTRIDARYQVRRAQCQALGGFRRDKCLVSAHAERGRSLLDVAAPYAVRYTH